jgi:adenylate kinase
MDRTEKLEYEKGIEQYFDEHKVYDLFEKLFKELVINKPENPIDYLIERLRLKEAKRIFITGHSGTDKKSISLALANELNYSLLNMEHVIQREISKKMENSNKIEECYKQNRLVDDEIAIDLVRNQLIKYEEENISYIIEGFPKNRNQAIFLQSIGLLPDNLIILTTSRENSENKIFEKLREKLPKPVEKKEEQEGEKNPEEEGGEKQEEAPQETEVNPADIKTDEQIKEMAKISVEETDMNIRAVEDVFSGFYCEIPVDKFSGEEEVRNELLKLLKFKNKTNAARRPPRIIMATPPCIDKNGIADKVCNQLKIIHVNIMDLLRKEIEKKNENSLIILDSLEKNELVDDKFVLKLLEDRLFCSDCMINGWIVTGFPKSNLQINFIEKLNPEIKPSLIVLVNAEAEEIKKMAEKIKFDPKTGKYYKQVEGDKFENVNNPSSKVTSDVINRLVPRNQDKPEILEKRLKVWEEVSKILSEKDFKNFLQLNGYENDEKKLSQLIIDAVGYNS